MSSSIAIPQRKRHLGQPGLARSPAAASSLASSSASYNSEAGAAPGTPQDRPGRDRRMSLLSSSLSHTEHIVVNIGSPEAPRLITCVRSSQGFEWNQELFLPASYYDHDMPELELRQDPVLDIVLTDEELANMLPS